MYPSSRLTALTFDIGNVLVQWDPRRAYEPLFNGDTEQLDYFLNNVCTLAWHTRHDQGVPFDENIQRLQHEFPEYADMIAVFEDEWANMFGPIMSETVEILKQLHGLSYDLYALTNFPADKFAIFKRQNSFINLFQDIIISGEEKITKPDPRIYQILLNRTARPAQQILFIDDRLENIKAAQNLGFQTHHFMNAKSLSDDLVTRGILPS